MTRTLSRRPQVVALATSPAVRDPWLDNVKLLALVLVVVGHSWTLLRHGDHTVKAAYLFVFTFHMPAFVVVAGYLSRDFDLQPRRAKRLIAGVLVPYLVFEAAYTGFADVAGGRHLPLSLLDPWWMTWFLLALFIWRVTAPVWRVVRYPFALSLAISILASTSRLGGDLALHRVLQLLPFFVLGMTLERRHLELLHTRPARLAAAAVLAAGAGAAWFAVPHDVTEFFLWRSDRSAFPDRTFADWFALRTVAMACAFAMTLAFLALVPRRRTWYTALGAGTLFAYLLHGFAIRGAEYAGFFDRSAVHTPLGIAAVTLAAAAFAMLLCTPPVRRAFRVAVEPRLDWAFRAEPQGSVAVEPVPPVVEPAPRVVEPAASTVGAGC